MRLPWILRLRPIGERHGAARGDLGSGLATDSEGRFEIIISADRPDNAPNWIQIGSGARSLVARQYFIDRGSEAPADYEIGRCGSAPAPAGGRLDPKGFAHGLLACGQSLERAVGATLRATDAWSQSPNTISFDSGAGELADLFPTPDNHYVGGCFQLEEDEGLVVEVQPPDCRYWNLHLMSRWLESLDPNGGPVSLNLAQADIDSPDGSVRFIISARDPGKPNWLDTGGRREGGFALRWLQARSAPQRPSCRLIKLDEL